MPGLYAVRNDRNNVPMVNFFIMQAGEKYIAIDAGYDSSQTENALQWLGISADDVVAVFITHSDYDHIGGIKLFKNAATYSWDTEFRYAEAVRFAPAFDKPDIPHHTMADGEVVELHGRTIQSFHTSGHKSDSLSFVVDGKYLFVGDLLVTLNNAQDAELQELSRRKVLSMDGVEYIFTGHFGLFKGAWFFRWWYS
jgi:glyoxylase-like metal-dependent hydrolase (beta-lactamase superfamily II)